MNDFFRVYTSSDILGIELGGALKNVVALAAGIADGLGYGDNAKAALITRGISEIARLGIAMGGQFETFCGLTGIGDLSQPPDDNGTHLGMENVRKRLDVMCGGTLTVSSALGKGTTAVIWVPKEKGRGDILLHQSKEEMLC